MSCSVSTATSGALKPWSSGTMRAASARARAHPASSCKFQALEAMILEQAGEPSRAPVV